MKKRNIAIIIAIIVVLLVSVFLILNYTVFGNIFVNNVSAETKTYTISATPTFTQTQQQMITPTVTTTPTITTTSTVTTTSTTTPPVATTPTVTTTPTTTPTVATTPTVTGTPTTIQQQQESVVVNVSEVTKDKICYSNNVDMCTAYMEVFDSSGTSLGYVSSGFETTGTDINGNSYTAVSDSQCVSVAPDVVDLETSASLIGLTGSSSLTGAYYCKGICSRREDNLYSGQCCGYMDGFVNCIDYTEDDCDASSDKTWCPLVISQADTSTACSISSDTLKCCIIDDTAKLCGSENETECAAKGDNWTYCS